jgi:hypothetical protein
MHIFDVAGLACDLAQGIDAQGAAADGRLGGGAYIGWFLGIGHGLFLIEDGIIKHLSCEKEGSSIRRSQHENSLDFWIELPVSSIIEPGTGALR